MIDGDKELSCAFVDAADVHWKLYALHLLSAVRLYRKGEKDIANRIYSYACKERDLSSEYNRKAYALGVLETT